MVCRNQRHQSELNERRIIELQIKDLEEYRKTTVDDWKSLKELKDIVKQLGNDNDRLKQDIDTVLLR